MSYLFITHDLNTLRHISHRIAVMYLGQIVDVGPSEAVFSAPHHPYTESLLSAAATLDADRSFARVRLRGSIPSPSNPPSGCRFHTRCPMAQSICREIDPVFELKQGRQHYAACHFAEQARGRVIKR